MNWFVSLLYHIGLVANGSLNGIEKAIKNQNRRLIFSINSFLNPQRNTSFGFQGYFICWLRFQGYFTCWPRVKSWNNHETDQNSWMKLILSMQFTDNVHILTQHHWMKDENKHIFFWCRSKQFAVDVRLIRICMLTLYSGI